MAPQPPITEPELRDWLLDAGLDVDDTVVARLLLRLQPMRVRLRAAGLSQLEPLLRGNAMAAGWSPPRGAVPSPRPTPDAPVRVVTAGMTLPPARARVQAARFIRRGNWFKRLGLLYMSSVMGLFALTTVGGGRGSVTLCFVVLAVALLLVAVTGKGLSGADDEVMPLPPGGAADPARSLAGPRDDGAPGGGTLAGRLGTLVAALVAGGFGIISMWGGVTSLTLVLFGASAVLLLAGLTGGGLTGDRIGVASVLTALLMAYAGVALLRFSLAQYRASRALTDPGSDLVILGVLATLGVALVVVPAAMVVRGARK